MDLRLGLYLTPKGWDSLLLTGKTEGSVWADAVRREFLLFLPARGAEGIRHPLLERLD